MVSMSTYRASVTTVPESVPENAGSGAEHVHPTSGGDSAVSYSTSQPDQAEPVQYWAPTVSVAIIDRLSAEYPQRGLPIGKLPPKSSLAGTDGNGVNWPVTSLLRRS